MAQTTLETLPASPYAILVTLRYGDPATPTIKRYARWTSDVVVGAETFLVEPALDVELGQQHGDTEDRPHKLTIPTNRDPFPNLILGYKHSSVEVIIEQINPLDTSTRRHLGQGRIITLAKNPNRRPSLVRATIGTIKIKLAEVHVGIQANTTCDNEFGNGPYSACQLDVSAWIRTGTVVSVQTPDRNVIELNLTGITDPAVQLANERYRRGYIEVDGLRLLVKRSQENESFELFSIPAPYLVGLSCILHPGCGGRLEDCRLWENEEHFNGIGIKIPSRNPVFEQPNG